MPFALPAVAIALILLIFAFAMVLLIESTVGKALSGAPVIGGWLNGQVYNAAMAAYNSMVSRIVSGCAGLVSTFAFPIVQLHSLIDNIGAAAEGGVLAAQTLRGYTIPLVVEQLTSLAYWAESTAQAAAVVYQQQVVGLVWDVKGIVDGEIATLSTNLTSLAYWARDAAESYAYSLALSLNATIGTLSENLQGLIWDLHNQDAAAIAAAESNATAQIASLERSALQDIANARTVVEGELSTAIDGVDARVIAGDAATAAAASAAIAAVASAVQAIEDMPCIQECATLGPFGSMLDDIDLAAIVALATAALTDPSGTATFIQDVVAPIVEDAGSTAEQLLGVVVQAA